MPRSGTQSPCRSLPGRISVEIRAEFFRCRRIFVPQRAELEGQIIGHGLDQLTGLEIGQPVGWKTLLAEPRSEEAAADR